MIITFTNVIGAIRTAFSVVRSGLKMWLGFETSETLGREEVVNGDFSDGTNNWTTTNSTISIEGGALKIISTGGNRPQANQIVNGLVVGSQYKLSAVAKRGTTANDVEIEISGIASLTTSNRNSTTEYETIFYIFTATATSHTIQAKIDEGVEPSGTTAYFSNVSLKELTQITPDKSGNNNVGELFTGKALEFDGSTEYVDLGNSISNTTYDATTKITIVGWFQIEQISDMLFSQGTNFYLFNDGNGDLKLQGGSNSTNFGSTPSGMNRIVTVLDGLNVRGYINGVEVANQTIPTFTTDSNNLILGKFYNNAFFLNGLIADFQVYNSAWTQDDVTFDYANPNKLAIDNPSTNLVVTNLKGYWALSEGDGLVAYDSGTNLEEEEVQNGTFNLGSEEVTDGDFSSSVNWADSGNQWVINNNTATYTGDGTANDLLQEISFIGGRTYEIKIDVASIGGTLKVRFDNDQTNKAEFSQTGIQTLYITATGSGNITDDLSISREPGVFNAVLNSVSVKEVPNWTLGDGWSVANGVAIQSGGVGQLYQTGVLAFGKSYSVSVTIDSIASGTSLKVSLGSGATALLFPNIGTTTLIGSTHSSVGDTKLYLLGNESGFSGSISNVSVREVTASDHGGLIVGAEYVLNQPRIPQLGMMNWSKGSNLFPFSEDFENSDWTKNAGTTITNNYALSPNGTQTASRYLGTGESGLSDKLTLSTVSYTLSFYVKSNTSQTQLCRLVIDSSQVTSDLSVTTDWTRISHTATASGLADKSNGIFRDSNDNDLDILIWGAQLEQSSSVGAYRLTDRGATLNSTVIPNPTIPTQDIFGNLVRDRLNSFNLDGSGYATNETLPTISGNISLSFWVKLDTFVSGNLGQILGKREGSSWLRVYRPYASHLRLEVAASQQYTFPVTENQWVYVAITINNSNQASVYVDDSAALGATLGTSFSFINTEVFAVGAWLNPALQPTSKLNGLVSDVLIYDRVLTVEEVENNYNAGLSAHTNN